MSKFLVKKPEVHIATYIVNADNEKEAIQLVKDGHYDDEFCDEIELEYSHTMDEYFWKTELYSV